MKIGDDEEGEVLEGSGCHHLSCVEVGRGGITKRGGRRGAGSQGRLT